MEFQCRSFQELTVDELYEILKARCDVFIVEQNCPYPDIDGLDRESLHLFARLPDGSVTACLRLFPRIGEPGVAQMGRVLTTRRGEGLGRELLRRGINAAFADPDCREIYLEAQTYAAPFYAREGFRICSEEFTEDGIPHVGMRLKREE